MSGGMFETGAARQSMHRIDPVLHLLVRNGAGWATWCGGGPAEPANTPRQRRCSKCLTLARADLANNQVGPDEASDLDWYLERVPQRKQAQR
jgi:hypothetical protein